MKESKSKVGMVVRHSGDKTAIVLVERMVKQQTFKKYIRKRKKFCVHDAKNVAKVGDKVKIVECRPVSKTKSWMLQAVLEKAE